MHLWDRASRVRRMAQGLIYLFTEKNTVIHMHASSVICPFVFYSGAGCYGPIIRGRVWKIAVCLDGCASKVKGRVEEDGDRQKHGDPVVSCVAIS